MSAELFKVTINVTADDISAGVKSDCRSCPIARALVRTLPLRTGFEWIVGVHQIIIRDRLLPVGRADVLEFKTPLVHQGFVLAFDTQETRGKKPEPMTYELDVPVRVRTFLQAA